MRYRRPLIIVVLLGILIYIGYGLEERMLYYPSKDVPGDKSLASRGMQFWPSGRDGYRGFVSMAPVRAGLGTIVVFHGNAGSAPDRDYYVAALAPLGFRVLLVEYPGYGGRGGKLGERSFVDDAHETLRQVAAQYGGPVYLLGESLGCGVVASVVKSSPVPIDGIILITPWDTLASVAKHHYPWLPVGLFLHDKFDSVRNLADYRGLIAVVGAERDEVIPIRHAQALFEALRTRKKMWIVRDAGHNDWSFAMPPAGWMEVTDFVTGNTGRN